MVCLSKSDAERWHELFEHMLGLIQQVPPPAPWNPSLPENGTLSETYAAWRAAETAHLPSIHACARELVRTGSVQSKSPEVHYFLGERLSSVLRALDVTFAWRDDRLISIIPFPDSGIEAVAEWYLTDWADWHTAGLVIREEDFPSEA
jgi:hypothetical protein